jgi:hypothetical protein
MDAALQSKSSFREQQPQLSCSMQFDCTSHNIKLKL